MKDSPVEYMSPIYLLDILDIFMGPKLFHICTNLKGGEILGPVTKCSKH